MSAGAFCYRGRVIRLFSTHGSHSGDAGLRTAISSSSLERNFDAAAATHFGARCTLNWASIRASCPAVNALMHESSV